MRLAAAVALFGIAQTGVAAQGADTALARSFALDFTVPEAPAFELLEIDRSTILRPSTTRELAVAASRFLESGAGLVLPRSFGVELAPWLLVRGPRLTRRDYTRAPFLYRLRVSAATARPSDSLGVNAIALGIRTTLLDGGDLRTNRAGETFRALLTDAAMTEARAKAVIDDAIAALVDDPEVAGRLSDSLFARAGRGERLAVLARGGLDPAQAEGVVDLLASLTRPDLERLGALRDSIEEALWNAPAVEVAAAVLAQARDSGGRDLRTQQFAFWATAGVPAGAHGQLLVGARLAGVRESASGRFALDGALSGRLYGGANTLKGFVELAAALREQENGRLTFQSGGEVAAGRFGWVSFSAGLEFDRETRERDLVTRFVWHLAIP